MCLPFDRFHAAVEEALGRPVWTHEFAFSDKLKKEFEGKADAPTMGDIINLIPESKRVLVVC